MQTHVVTTPAPPHNPEHAEAEALIALHGRGGALYVASEICMSLDHDAIDAVRRLLDAVGKPAYRIAFVVLADESVRCGEAHALRLVRAICVRVESRDPRAVAAACRVVDKTLQRLRERG